MGISARRELEKTLAAVEERLAKEPNVIDLQFQRACLLASLGQIALAQKRYLEILHQEPTHFGTLNNFGTLLYDAGYYDAARTVYANAVSHHPEKPLTHVNLANLLLIKGELIEAKTHYEMALRLNPDNAAAHQGLSALYQEVGDEERMHYHRELGFRNQPMKTMPYRGHEEPIPILLIVSSAGGDLPWRRLVDDRIFEITTLVAAFCPMPISLERYKLIFNIIGDADVSEADLEAAETLLEGATVPIINAPASVLATGRMANAQRLEALPNVVVPRVVTLPREKLEGSDAANLLAGFSLSFPLLLRRPGFHTGKHFVRVDHAEEISSSLATLPGKELLAIEYLNAFGPDGYARKYRVMMINGELYPLHLAISEQWKVHYFSAAMKDQPAHQAEEAEFLNDMPHVLGQKGMTVLRSIQTILGLDYAGIDFGIDAKGNILLFEANADMIIIDPSAEPQWDYRRAAINRALEAARRMLVKKAG